MHNCYAWHDPHTGHYRNRVEEDKHPHIQAHAGPPIPNDQAQSTGTGLYKTIASSYGRIVPGHTSDLKFYRGIHHVEPAIDKMVADKGYQSYFAGGKYGRPDLANKNYSSKHLMIYDPSPESGASFEDEPFTRSWRKIHELSHAETYSGINDIYGEGKRLGKLGVRTPREMKRAVHWEWDAVHKQRELSGQAGLDISDQDFNKEVNTVLHDAVHRAVTGKFTEPHREGFVPSAEKVPLHHALAMVHEHAKQLGLRHDEDTFAAMRQDNVANAARTRIA